VKLRAYMVHAEGQPTDVVAGYHHWCPACDEPHGIAVTQRNRSGAVWTFNGNFDKPTFRPSVRCFATDPDTGQQETLCHYFITNGEIVYCNDNPHDFNGRTVPLPEWPERRMID